MGLFAKYSLFILLLLFIFFSFITYRFNCEKNIEEKNKSITIESLKVVLEDSNYDERVIDKYFDKSYIQYTDGKTFHINQFKNHIKKLKESVKNIRIDIINIIVKGDKVVSNHVVYAEKTNGKQIIAKVISEITLKDGKIIACDELTHLISGEKNDKNLGAIE